MVSENPDVIIHHVENRVFHVTLEIFEIECSLNHVAGIDEYHILFRLAHRVYDGFAREYSTASVIVEINV